MDREYGTRAVPGDDVMRLRPYDAETDRESTRRIWLELGWLKDDDDFDDCLEAHASDR